MQKTPSIVRIPLLCSFILLFISYSYSQQSQRRNQDLQHAIGDRMIQISDSQKIKVKAGITKIDESKSFETGNCGTQILSPSTLENFEVTGEFIVNYSGFSLEAQEAFDHAIKIWSRLITTSVPIKINASFSSLGPDILGSAGPTYILRDIENESFPNTYYPAALADQLNGLDNVGIDIEADFNINFNNWYFGLDGCPGPIEYDFVTVAMHEVAHGLGIFSSPEILNFGPFDGNLGCYGYDSGENDPLGFPIFIPIIFDHFVENGMGQKVTSFDPNFCWSTLTTMFTGDDLYYNGPNTRQCFGDRLKLYAPLNFLPESSYSHLDEDTYVKEDVNSLMTPFLMNGEAIHDPGCSIGMLQDFGYQAHNLKPIQLDIPTIGEWATLILIILLLTISVNILKINIVSA